MGTYASSWEDEENNRIVEFSVEYNTTGGELTIDRIVPQAVAFVCETTGEVVRRIGVHTAAGRKMLARQYELHVGLEGVWQQIDQSLRVSA